MLAWPVGEGVCVLRGGYLTGSREPPGGAFQFSEDQALFKTSLHSQD